MDICKVFNWSWRYRCKTGFWFSWTAAVHRLILHTEPGSVWPTALLCKLLHWPGSAFQCSVTLNWEEIILNMQGCGSAFIFCESGSSSFSKCGSGSSCLKMRIRIQLPKNADPDPAQTNKIKITLLRVFFSCKRHKRLLKSKKQRRFANLLKNLNKLAVIINFLAFFLFLFEKFSLLDPDPGVKMNADPSGSGSIALIIW